MTTRVLGHVRSNAIAYVALFFALGGGVAWALDANSVKSRHIADHAVKSRDVARNAIKSPHIARQTIKAADVAPNTLGGRQIDEASLTTPRVAAGVVNPDGTIQAVTSGVTVEHQGSGQYLIKIPLSIMPRTAAPVPVFTPIADAHVTFQKIGVVGNEWQITVHFSGGDHLFEFIAAGV